MLTAATPTHPTLYTITAEHLLPRPHPYPVDGALSLAKCPKCQKRAIFPLHVYVWTWVTCEGITK